MAEGISWSVFTPGASAVEEEEEENGKEERYERQKVQEEIKRDLRRVCEVEKQLKKMGKKRCVTLSFSFFSSTQEQLIYVDSSPNLLPTA